MKKIRRLVTAAISAAMIFSLNIPVHAQTEGEAFDEFMEQEFIELMESDYMTMHFTVRDYRKMGITKPEPIIGTVSWDDYEKNIKEGNETLDKLKSFDYDKLNEEQQHDYDAYYFYTERAIELNSYPYFDWYFMPGEGLIDNLPTNFTEFVFYEKQDIDDYLKVLDSVSDLIDQALEVTDIQVKAGYFMTDSALDSTLDAIDKFVTRTDDNPLIVIFEENVDAFAGLSDAEKADYKNRNKEILMNSYIPAYNRAASQLETYRGTRKADTPICDLKEGKEYYTAKVKSKMSDDITLENAEKLVTSYVKTEISNLISLIYSVRDQSVFDEEIELGDPTEILQYHEKNMSAYPEGPSVKYKASYLDPAVASDSIVAYYLEPAIDDIENNVVKINGDNVGNKNELYSTLAHEGFPGHLYQITWYLSTQPAKLRNSLSLIGYTEGWAMYAEDDAWSYSTLSDAAKEYLRIDTSLSYAINAVADIGVNGLGWTENDLKKYLTNLGLTDDMAQDLYDFVLDTPGVIIPYGAGLSRFMTLRTQAKAALGEEFDLKEFNTVLLTYGNRPFTSVEKDVRKWMSEKGTADLPDIDGLIPDTQPRTASPLLYAGGAAAAAVLILIGIIMIRKARKSDPFA